MIPRAGKPAEGGALLLASSSTSGRATKPAPACKSSAWDMETGNSFLGGGVRARAARPPKAVLLGGAGLLLVVLAATAATSFASDSASPADMAALVVAAKAKVMATAAASSVALGAAAAARLSTTAARPPPRTRPRPPANRPADLPRTAFDRHMEPAMTPGEALTLQWYASQAGRYVEYGSGASTLQAAVLAGSALSIENGVPWCKEMEARADVRFWVAQGKLDYVCVDIGATGENAGKNGVGAYGGQGVCGGGGSPPTACRCARGDSPGRRLRDPRRESEGACASVRVALREREGLLLSTRAPPRRWRESTFAARFSWPATRRACGGLLVVSCGPAISPLPILGGVGRARGCEATWRSTHAIHTRARARVCAPQPLSSVEAHAHPPLSTSPATGLTRAHPCHLLSLPSSIIRHVGRAHQPCGQRSVPGLCERD